ncbi:uncharacterized protein LOC128954208 isoform X2 [Oppia nitens]|uniref:uncharacterized protein LOC128954208 isoform X2 n=1 Tax=Oppia nitens TaxID=1686743 RepID=UPI0023DA394E|nr:uncharacterized protein LOC128954208 isoform X2 [Oppia nitens]
MYNILLAFLLSLFSSSASVSVVRDVMAREAAATVGQQQQQQHQRPVICGDNEILVTDCPTIKCQPTCEHPYLPVLNCNSNPDIPSGTGSSDGQPLAINNNCQQSGGCICAYGYVRCSRSGQCIPLSQCPAPAAAAPVVLDVLTNSRRLVATPNNLTDRTPHPLASVATDLVPPIVDLLSQSLPVPGNRPLIKVNLASNLCLGGIGLAAKVDCN